MPWDLEKHILEFKLDSPLSIPSGHPSFPRKAIDIGEVAYGVLLTEIVRPRFPDYFADGMVPADVDFLGMFDPNGIGQHPAGFSGAGIVVSYRTDSKSRLYMLLRGPKPDDKNAKVSAVAFIGGISLSFSNYLDDVVNLNASSASFGSTLSAGLHDLNLSPEIVTCKHPRLHAFNPYAIDRRSIFPIVLPVFVPTPGNLEQVEAYVRRNPIDAEFAGSLASVKYDLYGLPFETVMLPEVMNHLQSLLKTAGNIKLPDKFLKSVQEFDPGARSVSDLVEKSLWPAFSYAANKMLEPVNQKAAEIAASVPSEIMSLVNPSYSLKAPSALLEA